MPPTGEPVKEQIIANLVTSLEAIVAGSDYYHTVRKVHRLQMGPLQLRALPAIVVSPLSTAYDPRAESVTNSITGKFQVELTLVLRTRTTATKEVERFIRDVHKKLLSDTTLSSKALDVRVLSDEPFYPAEGAESVAGAEILVEILYRTNRTDLNLTTT